ncbi:hypothetical protein HU200_056164 [Digitaria exilis]|uniref:F-box domain-containing protein n=1 Tax=Digitaria exilis TaxID=1010633 RepID=A0A835E657_9POAL|nr:hypothetical protein HU200_056164 [Digitaria exilis]
MPRKAKGTMRWVPVNRPGEASSSRGHQGRGGGGGADSPAADRLSALPDALLHHVMSFMKAWDVARTCVLSRRWRDLWASAPCVDIRVGRYSDAPEDYAKFVYRLLLSREALAPVETLRLCSPGEDDHEFDMEDVRMWIRHAIRQNVQLELKQCVVGGCEIVSTSLKCLTMVKCKFTMNLSVDAPRLVSLQCMSPENWVPLFKNFGVLVTGSVMLDDSLLSREFEKYQEEDEFPQTSDEDDDNNSRHNDRTGKDDHSSCDSHDWGDFYDYYSDPIKDNYDYGSDINSDTDTYEYSEIVKGIEIRQFENHDDGPDCSKGIYIFDVKNAAPGYVKTYILVNIARELP